MWSVCACACAPENRVCVCVCMEDYLCTVRLLGVLVCIYFWVYPGVYCTRALAGRSGKAEPSDGWWQCDRSKWGLFFQAFIVNTAQDYRACKMGVLRKRKHRWTPGRKPGGRGGGSLSLKMFCSVKQLRVSSSFNWDFSAFGRRQATAAVIGFQLIGQFSARWGMHTS